MSPKLAVIMFPGNNCETETLRATRRAGFDSELLRWNTKADLSTYDAFVLPGGFSFEDRGRSGVVSSREKIFDTLRREAQRGKLILGICNGAQMVVESGLIPVVDDPLPFALARNVRRNTNGKVIGDGFFNTWVHLTPNRKNTAFTHKLKKQTLTLPIAHGEGRFTTKSPAARLALKTGSHVAFQYCHLDGKVDPLFPITPNNSLQATAGIVNTEGTICALMPHPERFFDACDGDGIFDSMHTWILNKRGPSSVVIGDIENHDPLEYKSYKTPAKTILIEKEDIITDNEAFTLTRTANRICGNNTPLKKSIRYEIRGPITKDALLETGLILNPNKEIVIDSSRSSAPKYCIIPFKDDESLQLSRKLSALLGVDLEVQISQVWHFEQWKKADLQKIINNHLFANPNAARVFQIINTPLPT